MAQAAARFERFQRAQAALDASRRLENRGDDLNTTHQPTRASSTLEQHRSAKRWFIEYLEVQTPHLDAERFFIPNNPPPDRVLLKQYAIYMALSRVGKIADTISLTTLVNYMRLLFTVFKIDRGRPLDASLREDVFAYISNDLVTEYQVSREKWKKAVAHSEYLSYLLDVLYTPQFIGTLPNIRQLLNVTIFLNLLVDSGARGGDIAWDLITPVGTCMLWRDVKLYAFWDPEIDAVDLRANITFRHLKVMKLDPGQYKTIPLSLFQTNMVREDTLRLILIMGLMDGVFANGVETWSALMQVSSSPNGTSFPLKASVLELPLLRKVSSLTNAISEDAEQLQDMQALTKRLGRAGGLEDRLTVYCLSRGVAYTLATKTSTENRRFLMGHKTASRIYSQYASKVATVDLASLYRNQEPRPVLQMSSMLLNSGVQAPQAISLDGRARVMLDTDYLKLKSKYLALRDELIARHGTVSAAARTNDAKYAEFNLAYNKQSHALRKASEKVYRQEYADFFRTKNLEGSSSSR